MEKSCSLIYILTGISVTCRALNLNTSKDGSDKTAGLINESFQYVIREYYIIIWAFLFKYDYAFKVFHKKSQLKILFLSLYLD